jgi:metallo-beta-lactamase family protein
MHVRFLGAAGEVTGSKHYLEGMIAGHHRRFIVDYGMFQGGRESVAKNLADFPVPPKSIDFIVLTHAHIDHSGLLPRLCAQGFEGPIYTTAATLDLLKILLADSAHLQKADLDRALRKQKLGKWRGDLPEVLYSTQEAFACLSQFRVVDYHEAFHPCPGITGIFHNAGHILGSAIADLTIEDDELQKSRRLVFTGDLGMTDRPLMPNPEYVDNADVLFIESTYGDRLHKTLQETEDELIEVITKTMKHGGNVIMPAFAVGRTQEILFILINLVKSKKLPRLNVFIDSPMATAATHLTERFFESLDEDAQEAIIWHKKHPDELRLRFTADVEESKALNKIHGGAIIISASGMCEAGRIVHHLSWNLPHQQNAVIITGFQAYGSLGRKLVDKLPVVKIMGKEVHVRASVHTIGGLSAHADQAGLLNWIRGFKVMPKKIFVIHGEANASDNFASVLTDELGCEHVIIPKLGSLYPC